MRHLIVGASGQVGSALSSELKSRGDEVVGTYLSHRVEGLRGLDMTDAGAVKELFDAVRPDVVWIPGAMPDVDRCEREIDLSYAVNVQGPARILECVRPQAIPLVYFSSDYVFDGHDGPYRETDLTHPLQIYGQHKVEAEEKLLGYEHTLVIRPAWIYSDEPNSRNFVFRVLFDLRHGRPLKAAEDQYNTPTPAKPLASHAVDALLSGYRGILHLTGPDRLSRFALVQRIAGLAGYASSAIEAVRLGDLSLAAKRPSKGGLVSMVPQFMIQERLEDMDFRQLLT